MNTIYKRQRQVMKNTRWTTAAWNHIQEQKREAGQYRVLSSAEGQAIVIHLTGVQHIVKLKERICTCLEFQDRELPCRHAIAVCDVEGKDPETYISNLYSI